MPESTSSFDVFISYNSEEQFAVAELCERLRDEGKLHPWRDQEAIQLGEEWEPSIEAALHSCPCCLIIFGPKGWSEYHFREAAIALNNRNEESRLRVILVLLPGTLQDELERVPAMDGNHSQTLAKLRSLQWVDFSKGGLQDDSAFLRLVAAIQGRQLPPEKIPVLTPYRVNKDALRWQQDGHSSRYLYSRGHLEEAQKLDQRESAALTQLAREFLSAGLARRLRNRRLTRAALGVGLAAIVLLIFSWQSIVDAGFRKELLAHNLPAGIYHAPALESIEFEEPLASLDWIRPPLTQLKMAINEDGTPNGFPPFLTALAISGHADGRSLRFYVDVSRLPPQLSALSLEGVSLQNPEQLGSLKRLKSLSLKQTFLNSGQGIKLPPGLEGLETDDSFLPSVEDFSLMTALKTLRLTGSGYTKFDARLLPASLVSLSISKLSLTNTEALATLPLQELETDDPELLDQLPKSVTTLRLVPAKLDSRKLAMLRAWGIDKLAVELPPAPLEKLPEFDVQWLPAGIRELSFSNLVLIHNERFKELTKLKKMSGSLGLADLPASVEEASTTACIDPDDMKSLPVGLRRLAIGCIDTYRELRLLRRFPSLLSFAGLEISDGVVNFKVLPATLQELAIAAASADVGTISNLKALRDLSLNFRPGTGGSDVAGGVAENLSAVNVNDLPRSLTRLQLANLTLTNGAELANLEDLLELTVDRYTRGSVGIPKSLKKLIVKGEVSDEDFRKMVLRY